jgi:hypothetical protein
VTLFLLPAQQVEQVHLAWVCDWTFFRLSH